jgi:hypothetical protein
MSLAVSPGRDVQLPDAQASSVRACPPLTAFPLSTAEPRLDSDLAGRARRREPLRSILIAAAYLSSTVRGLVIHKTALLTSAVLASGTWLSAGAEAADRIYNLRILGETPGGLIAAVSYRYDSQHGDNIFIAAVAETSAGVSIGTWVRPWPVRKGLSRAYVHLGYSGASPHTSQRVRFYMYAPGAGFHEQSFDFNKSWAREPDTINPDTVQTTFQNARVLGFSVLYLLTSSHSRPVRMGVTPLKNGAANPVGFGFSPSAPLVSGSGRTASTQLSYVGASNDSSEGLLVFLYEEGGPIFYQTVLPRMKYWASSTTDTDGDGISDVNESVLATFSFSRDTDDDGLEDGWELEGYRWSGNQYHDSNLPFRGASPRRRDVFVEVDHIVDIIGGALHDHRMNLDSIYKAKELYATMPILNLDGTLGVNLLIIPGSPIRFDGDVGGVCGMRRFPSNFPERKQRIYHWAVAAHGIAGQSEPHPSNRFVFGTGNGNPYGGTMTDFDKFAAYAAFVHELGHNLGLAHGGRDDLGQTNCKANYPSLMNYAYDYSFNCSEYDLATTEILFSGGGSPVLRETALREFGNTELDYVRGFDADGLGCNWYRFDRGLIDWNRTDAYDFGFVSRDITGDAPSCGPNGLQIDQRDFNDFETIIDFIDDSIERPLFADCDSAVASNGYVHDADQRGFEPVCGIPQFGRLSDHPWLKANPVFALRPGMEIRHPEMKRLLRDALEPGDRLRLDVPLEKKPVSGVFGFDSSSDRKRARQDDSEIHPRRDER